MRTEEVFVAMKKMKRVAAAAVVAAVTLVVFLSVTSGSADYEEEEHAPLRHSRRALETNRNIFRPGDNFCSPSSPCGLCKGDCDTDKDCKGTLKCYQRRDPSVPALVCEGVVEDDSSK
jgi:hypothetical protein